MIKRLLWRRNATATRVSEEVVGHLRRFLLGGQFQGNLLLKEGIGVCVLPWKQKFQTERLNNVLTH